jgi:hypothetical protein
MSKSVVHNIVTKSHWTEPDGEVRERWIQIGIATEIERGLICRLDSLPVGNWDHTFCIFPREERLVSNKTTKDPKPTLGQYKTPSKVIRQQLLTELQHGPKKMTEAFDSVIKMHPDVKRNRVWGVFHYMLRQGVLYKNQDGNIGITIGEK